MKPNITVAPEAAVSGLSPDGTTKKKRRKKDERADINWWTDKSTVMYGPYTKAGSEYRFVTLTHVLPNGRAVHRTAGYNRYLLERERGGFLPPGLDVIEIDGKLQAVTRTERMSRLFLGRRENIKSAIQRLLAECDKLLGGDGPLPVGFAEAVEQVRRMTQSNKPD